MGETPRLTRAHKNERGGHAHDRVQAHMNVADAAIAADASISVNGAKLELIDRGRGRPILFLHPHIGIEPSAPVLAMLADGWPAGGAVASGLRPLRAAADAHDRGRPRLFLSRCHGGARSRAGAGGRRLLRRLDRGGDRGEIDRADVAAGARQSGRHQGRRPRDPRHPRHLRDDWNRSSWKRPSPIRRLHSATMAP